MTVRHIDAAHADDPAGRVFTFGGAPPIAAISPHEVVTTWTEDCFGGVLDSPDVPATRVLVPGRLNPQSGPFFVEGAEVGDTLAVHLASVRPSRTWGVSATVPFFGALTGTGLTATLQGPLPERTWIYELDRERQTVRFSALDSQFAVDLPMDPMLGTIGVAPPEGEVRSALTPGSWGGNMDTPEMRAGVTCYLGVNVPGALLSVGDGHARQGEGESCGVAVETAMDVAFVVEVVKGVHTPWPKIESDSHVMSTGSSRPLEDAFRISHVDMVQWMAAALGLSLMDAYQLVAQSALTPVANVCDTVYTVVAKMPKLRVLPPVFGGVHERLRDVARAAVGR